MSFRLELNRRDITFNFENFVETSDFITLKNILFYDILFYAFQVHFALFDKSYILLVLYYVSL